MPTLRASTSTLLVIDVQKRLMPVIDQAEAVIANARRLAEAAAMLDVPALYTEQYVRGLGQTVAELAPPESAVAHKMTFDACAPDLLGRLAERQAVVVAGAEAHICVLQTVLSLLGAGRHVYVVEDATGSRRAESKVSALRRMERHGAEIVTTEMVIFEWLGTAEHPRFRDAVALIK